MEDEKIGQIRTYVKETMENSKKRSNMYGNLREIEVQWLILDDVYMILEDIPWNKRFNFRMADFGFLKGFSAKAYSTIIREMNPADPYLELIKLRNEYEEWREKRIAEFKKNPNSSEFPAAVPFNDEWIAKLKAENKKK
jgi:hypothetical protein